MNPSNICTVRLLAFRWLKNADCQMTELKVACTFLKPKTWVTSIKSYLKVIQSILCFSFSFSRLVWISIHSPYLHKDHLICIAIGRRLPLKRPRDEFQKNHTDLNHKSGFKIMRRLALPVINGLNNQRVTSSITLLFSQFIAAFTQTVPTILMQAKCYEHTL